MLAFVLGTMVSLVPQDTLTLSLDQAVARALLVSPTIAAAEGAVAAPRGLRAESRLPFVGPVQVEGTRATRAVPGQSDTRDWGISVRQSLDISGGSFVRARAASSRIDAAGARIEDARRLVTREVQLGFVNLVLADQRQRLLDSAATLGERLADITRRRLEAGELTLLDANAAVIEAARQRSAAGRATADWVEARATLGRLLALPPDSIAEGRGLPSLPDALTTSPASLLPMALAGRPDLLAARRELDGARQDQRAARSTLIPILDIGWAWAREGADARLGGLIVGLRLPVFQRAQGARGEATAALAAREADQRAIEQEVRAEVLAAAARYARARESATRFDTEILTAADENVRLSERALEEGELGIRDVVVLRSLALAARLEHLDVLRETLHSWYTLAAALAASASELQTLTRDPR